MTVDASLTFEFRDEYNRKPIAEKLIRLLESDVDISPLVIDGGWGTGKSEFCHKLINLLESNEDTNLRSVYIDAFKADHADEPLMTLLAAVLKLLPEAEQKTLTEKALPAIRFGTKTVLKSAVSWVLKQEATDIADDFEDVLQDASDDAINHSIESILADHVKADESIEALKDALIELTKEKPIVIFVDELDRCRPNFAISMLESIKHIFDVEGVQFVLIVNNDQLKASVNHCYGVAVNAQKYLDKFIGYKFQISNVKTVGAYKPAHVSQEHFYTLVTDSKVLANSVLKAQNTGVYRIVDKLISMNRLSLREVETFVKHLEIYQTLTNNKGLSDNSFGYSLLKIIGVFSHCFKQEVFSYRSVNISELLKLMDQKKVLEIEPAHAEPLEIISALLVFDGHSRNSNKMVIDFSKETINSWKKVSSRIFSVFGYDDDAIDILMSVAAVLSLK